MEGTPNELEKAPRQPSDEELLLRYRQRGDRGAFEELVRRYERELYSYLRRYLGNATLAEDVFQATFLQVHRKRHLYEEGRPVRPWLYTIATNQAIDAARRAGRQPSVSLDTATETTEADMGGLVNLLETGAPGPLSSLETEERAKIVRESVQQLPEHLRTVVLLTYYQGLKYREAAEILGIPVGTVKSRLHAALTKLHEAWSRNADVREP